MVYNISMENLAQKLLEAHGTPVLKRSIILEAAREAGFADKDIYRELFKKKHSPKRGFYSISHLLNESVEEEDVDDTPPPPVEEGRKVFEVTEDNHVLKLIPTKHMTDEEWVQYNIAYQTNRRIRGRKKR
jgi:hypothetical protein